MTFEDASLILMKLGLIENLCQLIPKIIQNIETSTVLYEHS